MISSLIEDWARGVARGFVRLFAKSPITPNGLTVIGFLLNFPVAYVLLNGWFFWGGLLILLAGVFDMLDGALAKVKGRVTVFGNFLDSTLDRYSEVVLFAGLLIYFRLNLEADQSGGSILVYAAICGSLLISYARAKAESLNLDCKGGLLPRPERLVLIAACCLLHPLFGITIILIGLWILAVGTNLTAWQRIIHIWLTTSKQARLNQQNAEQNPAKVDTTRLPDENAALDRKRWSFRRS